MADVELSNLSYKIDVKVNGTKAINDLNTALSKLNLDKFKDLQQLNLNIRGVGGLYLLNKSLRSLAKIDVKELDKFKDLHFKVTVDGIEQMLQLEKTVKNIRQLNTKKAKSSQNISSGAQTQVPKSFLTVAGGMLQKPLALLANNSVSRSLAPMLSNLSSIGRYGVIAVKGLKGVHSAFTKINSLGKRAFRGAISGLKKLFQHSQKSKSSLGRLLGAFKRIALYRGMRALINAMISALQNGINNLYQYSSVVNGTFKSAMDTIATSTQYASNSLGAMVAPIINALAPAIDFLIGKFVALINIINQFFSRLLGGAGVFTKARKVAKSYGGAMGGAGKAAKKAAKEIKDATIGIDELNVIKKPEEQDHGHTGGGGAGGGFADMFEQAPIDDKIKEFADKVKKAFNDGNWEELGKLFGDKVNEGINAIDWAKTGTLLGKGLDGAIRTAFSFLDTIDWVNIGNKLSVGFNNAIANMDFTKAGQLLGAWVFKFWKVGIGFFDNLDYSLVATKIADFAHGLAIEIDKMADIINLSSIGIKIGQGITEILTELDFREIASTIKKFVESIVSQIKDLANNIDFTAIIANIQNGASVLFDTIRNLGGSLGEIINSLIRNIDWQGLAQLWCEGVWSISMAVVNYISTLDISAILNALSGIAKGILTAFQNTWASFNFMEMVAKFGFNLGNALTTFDWLGAIGTVIQIIGNVIYAVGGAILSLAVGFISGMVVGIGQSINNVVQGIGNIIAQVGSIVGTFFTENIWTPISNWFSENFSISKFLDWGKNVIQGLFDGIKGAISGVLGWLSSNVYEPFMSAFKGLFGIHSPSTVMEEQGNYLNAGLNKALEKLPQEVQPTMTELKNSIIKAFDGTDGGIQQKFNQIAQAMMTGLQTGIQQTSDHVIQELATLAKNLIEKFTATGQGEINETKFESIAQKALEAFYRKVQSYNSRLSSLMQNLGRSIVNNFRSALPISEFEDIARNVSRGFVEGLHQAEREVLAEIDRMSRGIKNRFKSGMKINSPSKVFAEFGRGTVEGYNLGLEEEQDSTYSLIDDWTSKIKDTAKRVSERNVITSEYSVNGANLTQDVQGKFEISTNQENAMISFYQAYLEPTLRGIAEDMKRQADKEETTVLEVSGKEIATAVKRQEEADGYAFI